MIRLSLMLVLLLSFANHAWAAAQENVDRFGPFGELHIYRASEHPRHVVLFVSGDGGWNLGVVDMAKGLAELDSMVVGIDIRHYISRLNAGRGKCEYPAAHFEELSHYVQKKYKFHHYTLPVLAGYSSGATMVYATLAQSPPNTFAGGISLGFCPDLKTSKPLCKGSGLLSGKPDKELGFVYSPFPVASKLYVLQGDIDKVCSTPDTRTFLSQVDNAELIELPKVGHGFSVPENWLPQFKLAYQNLNSMAQTTEPASPPDELSDLPLVELSSPRESDTLAVMVSGDGGWASIDKQVAEALNSRGIPVIGLDSLQYFWEEKDPDTASRDLARILTHYGKPWGAKKFMLIGYSMGADTLPFMVSRLPHALRSRVKVVALLGMAKDTDFEIHVSDWLVDTGGSRQVVPEAMKLQGMNVLCIYGEDDKDSACKTLDRKGFTPIEISGGHHFAGNYERLTSIILDHSR